MEKIIDWGEKLWVENFRLPKEKYDELQSYGIRGFVIWFIGESEYDENNIYHCIIKNKPTVIGNREFIINYIKSQI